MVRSVLTFSLSKVVAKEAGKLCPYSGRADIMSVSGMHSSEYYILFLCFNGDTTV